MKYYAQFKLSENISETPEGYLICLGVPIARTGDMDYAAGETPVAPGANGKVKISRDEKEVFRPETIASFEGKPVTIQHPEGFVEPDNWKDLAKGTMQNVRRGTGDFSDSLLADLLITDATAIALVRSGLREVSCGYEAEYIEIEPGKGMQTKIVGNHLALVREGRAGPAYSINDHKGDTKGAQGMKTLKEKFKELKDMFASTIDEASKAMDEGKTEPDKKDDKKSEDAMGAYDELVKICKDLGSKIDAMKPKESGDADPEKKDDKPAPSKDEDIEARLAKLEAMVAKILGAESAEAGDKDEEESEDDDMEGELVGDTASRAEILSPGIEITKDVKVSALKAAYATKDGKAVIDAVSGGKPDFKDKEKVSVLFIAASELMKHSRTNDLSKSKTKTKTEDSLGSVVMTPEKMNELHAKHYGLK